MKIKESFTVLHSVTHKRYSTDLDSEEQPPRKQSSHSMMDEFKKDVLIGLSKAKKSLPSKYFYDKTGDALFVNIMSMPEYYLTRAEMDIFKNKSDELITSLQLSKSVHHDIIDLGSGDGTKTIELLKELTREDYQFDYLPTDISKNSLKQLSQNFQDILPNIKIRPQHGDYFKVLKKEASDHDPKVVLFLGSNIGNLTDGQATDFLYNLGAYLHKGDKILLGVDLIKPKEIVLPAYNDHQGITRQFNLNLLARINRELDADFHLDQFEHLAHYEEEEGIAKSFLVSKQNQKVTILAINETFTFEKGEMIQTEISRKYNDQIIHQILEKTDLEVVSKVVDSKGLFADYVLLRN